MYKSFSLNVVLRKAVNQTLLRRIFDAAKEQSEEQEDFVPEGEIQQPENYLMKITLPATIGKLLFSPN